ncbi:hypothetical protein [Streptomyces violaceoruber]|uniref:hypothetical protein n=1 Tax=Streptomyces violaceoruber TaxID=1935 RepID=UPI003B434BEC
MTHAGPEACGTCRALARDGKPIEHEQCAARAVLLLPPDQPMYEDLVDLTDEQRKALPARFHTPVFDGLGQPNAWLCQVCWGDGWVSQWPCGPAQEKGAMVFVSEGAAADIAAEVVRLRARVAELETFAHGCDGEGCVLPHSSWCERAKKSAAENDGCTCPKPWPNSPQPHAGYCWLVSPPRNEVDEMRKRLAEDPDDSPLHHSYALGRDLPEVTPSAERLLSEDELKRALRGHLFGGGAS